MFKSRRMLRPIKETIDPRLGVVHPDAYLVRLYKMSLVRAIKIRETTEADLHQMRHLLVSVIASAGGEITIINENEKIGDKLQITHSGETTTLKLIQPLTDLFP